MTIFDSYTCGTTFTTQRTKNVREQLSFNTVPQHSTSKKLLARVWCFILNGLIQCSPPKPFKDILVPHTLRVPSDSYRK